MKLYVWINKVTAQLHLTPMDRWQWLECMQNADLNSVDEFMEQAEPPMDRNGWFGCLGEL